MLNILKNIFESKDSTADEGSIDSLQILCGLMIEAANTDGSIDTKEINKIKSVLINVFEENIDDVNLYLDKAIEDRNNSKSLYYYTSKINKDYSDQKKLLLIETLWEVILSDGTIHDYESSLIRRLSGLLYVSDIESGKARQRALNKISDK